MGTGFYKAQAEWRKEDRGGDKATKYYKSQQKQLKSRRANSNFGFFIMLLQIKPKTFH